MYIQHLERQSLLRRPSPRPPTPFFAPSTDRLPDCRRRRRRRRLKYGTPVGAAGPDGGCVTYLNFRCVNFLGISRNLDNFQAKGLGFYCILIWLPPHVTEVALSRDFGMLIWLIWYARF